jgi:Beta-galactosidase
MLKDQNDGVFGMNRSFKFMLHTALSRLFVVTILCIASSSFAGVSGAYCLFAVDQDVSNAPEWNFSSITGAAVRVSWSTIEPAQGTFSWTYLDTAVAKAQSSGKKVSISVIAGCESPQWVYNLATQIITLTGNDAQAGTSMPAPWDANYIAAWTDCISKLGARYGGLPAIAYFTATGLGHGEECYLCANRQDAPQFNAQRWLGAAQQIVAAYTAAAKGTPFVIAWGKPAPGEDGTTSGAMYQVYMMSSKVGFKADSLSSRFPNLKFLEGQLALKIAQNGQPVVFQALRASATSLALQQVITNGEKMNMGAFEVYRANVDDPAGQQVLSDFNRL